MRQRSFETIPVAEIARHAGSSVGGFYARFGSKDGLLQRLDERILADCLAGFDRALSETAMRSADLAGVVRAYTRVMVTKFREHREGLIQIIRAANSGASGWAERTAGFNRHVHGRLRTLLGERKAEIAHPEPVVAIELGLAFTSAAAREAVLGNSLRAYPVSVPDEQLIAELARMWIAYLTDAKALGGEGRSAC